MTKFFRRFRIYALTILVIVSTSCGSDSSPALEAIASDTVSITKGKALFEKNCSGCHNFKQAAIGPNLAGLTHKVPTDWIRHFIKDPETLLAEGDVRATKLYKRYQTQMPSFSSFSKSEVDNIIAFLHTFPFVEQAATAKDSFAIKNPAPDTITSSGIELNLQLVAQIPASSKKSPLTRIAKLECNPHDTNYYILDQRGILYKMQNNKPVLYLNLALLKTKFINEPGLATGFGSFDFHPEFQKNGLLYTTHTEAAGSKVADFKYADTINVTLQWVVTEWKTANPNGVPFKGKSRELLRVDMVAGIHGVQELTFNPLAKKGTEDYGQLFIGIGDGGSVENGYAFLTQRTDQIWGTIIRIDPLGNNSFNKNYGISKKNPFYSKKEGNTVREIYAYGFRNPNHITWTSTGEMLVTNIGQAHIESINHIQKGHNYGWPVREGPYLLQPYGMRENIYPLPENDTAYHITYPIAFYDHDEGKAIAGGYEYSGKEAPVMQGKFIFGDIPTGRLFYADIKDLKAGGNATIKEWHITNNGKRTTLRELCGNNRVDLHFGQDLNGEIYLLTKPDGKVYKIKQ